MSQNHTTNAAAIMRKNRVLDGPIHTQRVKNVTADTRRRSTGGLAGGFVERGDLWDFAVMRAALLVCHARLFAGAARLAAAFFVARFLALAFSATVGRDRQG
jgi:hypothetical protein